MKKRHTPTNIEPVSGWVALRRELNAREFCRCWASLMSKATSKAAESLSDESTPFVFRRLTDAERTALRNFRNFGERFRKSPMIEKLDAFQEKKRQQKRFDRSLAVQSLEKHSIRWPKVPCSMIERLDGFQFRKRREAEELAKLAKLDALAELYLRSF